MIELEHLRILTLDKPPHPGRPAHVSAASGLVRVGDRLYVVSDDENHLAVFAADGGEPGSLRRIFAGNLPVAPEARKRNKADAECITRLPAFADHPAGALAIFGSCSRRTRCTGVLLGLDAGGDLDGRRYEFDLSALHTALDARVGGLNIEGAVVLGDELVLLQRGNKRDRRNARIRLRLGRAVETIARARLSAEAVIGVEPVDLGEVEGVPLAFTDGAALADGRMVFTAIAEDTEDSYCDGPCRGAAIGVLAADGMVERIETAGSRYKVEGIEAVLEGDSVRVLLVTDADDVETPASLLACAIPA